MNDTPYIFITMKISKIKYKRIDIDKIKKSYELAIKKINSAKSINSVLKARAKIVKDTVLLDTYYNLAFIRWSLDTSSEFYQAEKTYYESNIPLLNEVKTEYIKSIKNSKFFDKIAKTLPNSLLKIYDCELISSSPIISEDLILEAEKVDSYSNFFSSLLIEFNGEKMPLTLLKKYMVSEDREVRKNAFYAFGNELKKHADFIDNNFNELVKIRTEMAKKLGFENYVKLGYTNMCRISYTQADVEKLRKNIVKYVVPKITKIRKLVADKLGIDTIMLYDYEAVFKNEEPKPISNVDLLKDSGKKLYDSMSKETSKFYKFMLDSDAFDCYSRPNKWGGGYETDLAKFNMPFILANFNGTSADSDVLTHEAGHAYASYQMSKNKKDKELGLAFMDVAETHSMSMEFFAYKYADILFGDQAEKYKFKHLLDAFTFLSYGSLVDAYQHEVYKNYNLTSEERNQTWNNLEKIYRPYLSNDGMPYFEKGTRWQYQMHIFENPFYYIDYVFAEITAFRFLLLSLEDYDKAFEKYNELISYGSDYGYLELLEKVGLPSPLDEENLKEIADKIFNMLINQLKKCD